jgi:acyl-CoA:acyl-CoA alkyltransferase
LRIESISLVVPSLCVTNSDIIGKIRETNSTLPPPMVDSYCRVLQQLLSNAGAETRYIRDRGRGETAFDLIIDAVRSALRQADIKAEQLDLLIFCGVGRGFLVPSNAAFICRALKINCDYFDVSDACMSWVRSLHICYNFLANRTYSKVLIVNGEFTVFEHGFPEIFAIQARDRLAYTFPAFTIGEAASATVLVQSPAEWSFRFRSNTSLAGLCTVPLSGYKEFSEPDSRLGLNGVNRLVSFGQQLTSAALEEMIRFVNETYDDPLKFDLWFPHAASAALCAVAARSLRLGNRLYSRVFPRYGNVVSASIPAAMAMAEREGILVRGGRIVLCPASAGMSLALVSGQY